jgi:hypothetical protein
MAAGPLATVADALRRAASMGMAVASPRTTSTGAAMPRPSSAVRTPSRKRRITGSSRALSTAVAARSFMPARELARCEQNTGLGSTMPMARSATSSWAGFTKLIMPHTA